MVSVRVECTPSDMLVNLNLAREFRGRVYATGNPQACFELGRGSPEMTLRIPLGTQCGTVQQVNLGPCLVIGSHGDHQVCRFVEGNII